MDMRTAPFTHDVVLSVNGANHAVRVDTRRMLLDAFLDKLGLAGSEIGCDHGNAAFALLTSTVSAFNLSDLHLLIPGEVQLMK